MTAFMDPLLPAAFSGAAVDPMPVAVTRWSARLVDEQCEHDYRVRRFPNDCRRALLMMALGAVTGTLNFGVELYAYWQGAPVASTPWCRSSPRSGCRCSVSCSCAACRLRVFWKPCSSSALSSASARACSWSPYIRKCRAWVRP
jgi:hypothetical protein